MATTRSNSLGKQSAAPSRAKWESDSFKAVFYSVLLALQFGFQPILMREFVAPGVMNTSLALVQELCKLVLALLLIQLEVGIFTAFKTWTLSESLRVAALPAFTYAVQNLLMFYSFQHLDFITYHLLNQTKLLFTALFVFLLMGLHQSRMQVLALIMLVCGAALLGGESKHLHEEGRQNHFWLGVVPILCASLLSGLGGALSQKNLVGRNSFLFSLELGLYSTLSLLMMLAFSPVGEMARERERMLAEGLMVGWDRGTAIPVLIQAMGGLCVGQVTKYAGGVKKGFAVVSGILLTTLLQEVIYDVGIPWTTCLAMPLVITSVIVHSMYPPAKKGGAKVKKP